MVTVKLHGIPYSTCTRRVITTCNEIGVKVDLVKVDLAKGEHKTPEFIATKQPFGIIPVLEDEDGFQVYESRAIARYVVAKYGKGSALLPPPTDVKPYALFEQAASIEYSAFDPPASGLAYERVFAPKKGLTTNEDKYLAGETFTLADLFHLPYGAMVYQMEPSLFDSRPAVKKWWDDITSRESWKAANAF
ncbi:glutathione S-transferase [Ceratobasidium sp. AG-Ba]|nr:glutathione S-transferase [Ceratobasidium sp. AG-Ba]QRW07759.1 glutathione S-transferase [Ceratobasidium sp. AG-Ba]